MRKLAVIFLFAILGNAWGQGVEITPQVSYLFGGRVNFYEGDLKIQDKGAFGINVAYDFGIGGGVEFQYTGALTYASFNAIRYGYEDVSFKVAVNHIQIGGYKDLGQGKLKGYVSGAIGCTIFDPTEINYQSKWNFTVSGSLGMKYFPLKFLGFKLFGRLFLPMEFAGGGVFCGIGTGGVDCGLGVSTFAILVQGDLGAGIILKFGGKDKSKK
ncbi:MAG: hypothetical protein KDC84_06455 [Crocinitomicaceae bacterium]|nr:hypothetical protein [Crocinitomicaceae bacterium]